jgi:hypothetical protein
MTTIEIEKRIKSYEEDIKTLKKMLELYDKTNNLFGANYTSMSIEIHEQINFCKEKINNLKKVFETN